MNTSDLAARFPQIHAQLTRREWLQLAAVSGGALAAGLSFKSAGAQDTPVEGGTWTMALAGNPTAYPITAPGALNDILVNKTIYNNLVQYQLVDNAIQVVPDLAESWEPNADASQYTFKLKSGCHLARRPALHLGRRRLHLRKHPEPRRQRLPARQPGQDHHRRGARRPHRRLHPQLPLRRPADHAWLQRRHRPQAPARGPGPQRADRLPAGSGRHRPVQVQRVLARATSSPSRRTPTTSKAPPTSTPIIFKIIPDGNARVAQAQSGEIDLAIVEPPQVEAMNESDSATVREVPQVQYYFFAVNHTSPTMQNVLRPPGAHDRARQGRDRQRAARRLRRRRHRADQPAAGRLLHRRGHDLPLRPRGRRRPPRRGRLDPGRRQARQLQRRAAHASSSTARRATPPSNRSSSTPSSSGRVWASRSISSSTSGPSTWRSTGPRTTTCSSTGGSRPPRPTSSPTTTPPPPPTGGSTATRRSTTSSSRGRPPSRSRPAPRSTSSSRSCSRTTSLFSTSTTAASCKPCPTGRRASRRWATATP